MIKILLITDQQSTNHSAIEGIFSSTLKACSTIVYLPKECDSIHQEKHRIFIPYKYKRSGLFQTLSKLINLDEIDVVIVRNLYPILKQTLDERNSRRFKVGFWKSWPHTYRRFYQSKIENKSKIRKYIEYWVKSYLNEKEIKKCDFFLPITSRFKEVFFSDINIATYPLGMGYDESIFSCDRLIQNLPVRFVYIGTIDKLRQTSLVIKAFHKSGGDFIFDLYTKSSNEEVSKVKEIIKNDNRISLKDPVSREDLPKVLCKYDVGVNFISQDKIFDTSSPTKIYEYYASDMPALMNYNPEFDGFLDKDTAFIGDFNLNSITQSIEHIVSLSSEDIIKMGVKGKSNLAHRSYDKMAHNLLNFLMSINKTNSE
jgi:hypothetical protein